MKELVSREHYFNKIYTLLTLLVTVTVLKVTILKTECSPHSIVVQSKLYLHSCLYSWDS